MKTNGILQLSTKKKDKNSGQNFSTPTSTNIAQYLHTKLYIPFFSSMTILFHHVASLHFAPSEPKRTNFNPIIFIQETNAGCHETGGFPNSNITSPLVMFFIIIIHSFVIKEILKRYNTLNNCKIGLKSLNN